jgi:hypothetical protein
MGKKCKKIIMKKLIQSVSVLLIVVFLSLALKAQQPAQKEKGDNSIEIAEPFDISKYNDFQEVFFDEFSIFVPKSYKIEKKWSIDGGGQGYKDNENDFNVSLSPFAPVPATTEKELPSYKERKIFINQIYAWMWSYQKKNGDYKYVTGINFKLRKRKGIRATISLHSKDPQNRELAEKIFLSIRFNDTSQKKDNKIKNKSSNSIQKQKKN